MILVGHGVVDSSEFRIGSGAFGALLYLGELITHILAGLRINLSCYSGRWVDEIRLNCLHRKTFIHAACESDEAGSFQSASGVFRCGLFGAAVVSTIPQFGLLANFLDNVEGYMDADPDTDAFLHAPASMTALTTDTAFSVEEVLLRARTVARTARLPRANLQVSGLPPGNWPSLQFAPPSVSHP